MSTQDLDVTELLDAADQMVAIEEQRARLGTILRATAEALHLPAGGDLNAIPATAAANVDEIVNLNDQLAKAGLHHADLHRHIAGISADLRSQNRAVIDLAAQRDKARLDAGRTGEVLAVVRDALERIDHALAAYDSQSADAVQNLLDDSTQAFADAGTQSERVEVVRDLLEGWYAAWPDSAVTDPHEGIAWQLVSLICAAEARVSELPAVAEQGCDDCSVEPGERHRYAGCPGNQRAAARTAVAP